MSILETADILARQESAKPHEFVGRRDRWCEICNQPDRAAIHQSESSKMIASLSIDLGKEKQRAARWKELCRRLCVGMPSVFESYEREVDGKVSATIETGGLYKCCADKLRALIDSDDFSEDEHVCQCGTRAVKVANVWRAA